MSIENIYPIAATSGGGFFASFLIGYFIKKIVKILMFILGGVLALLAYLQFQEIIDVTIKFDKIQSFAEDIINTIVANATAIFPNNNNSLIIDNNLGIPVSGSIAAGFVLGITRRG
jgi:uncharacterized membrane protein (Fun14 family)